MITSIEAQPRSEAVTHFQSFNPINICWEASGKLDIVALSSYSDNPAYQQQVRETEGKLKVLAGKKPLKVERQVVKGKLHVICSDEGATSVARALRDEAHLAFPGSASIPENTRR